MVQNKKKKILVGVICVVCVAAALIIGFLKWGRTELSTNISDSLQYDHEMELAYAKQFRVDYYQKGYALITIAGEDRFLVVPEGQEVPDDLAADVVAIKQPVQQIYLAASATMDMFASLHALDAITLSSIKQQDWYIEEAKQAMEDGSLVYAGKYNMPDYELLLSQKCQLSIQSTMIYHNPEVKEKLEELGIPVMVDHSSYEEHPLGRTEWIKLYGLLTGKEQKAQATFSEQEKAFTDIEGQNATGKTVAFFYITSNGMVSVRKSGDYVAKMIDLAGGTYLFSDLGDDTATSSVNLQMEDFYAKAKEADYLVYNSTIEGQINSLEDLLKKEPLLKDFKAVKDHHVWCTAENLYQDSMESGIVIQDFHKMLTQEETNETLTYLYHLE